MTDDLRNIPRAPGRLPLLGHALPLWRRPLDFVKGLRDTGDIVRVELGTMPVYFVTSPELTHEVLVEKGPSFDKGRFFERARVLLGNGLATADDTTHRRNRRLMQPMFHKARIATFADIMASRARLMADAWEGGRTLALDQEMYRLTIDTMSDTLFSSAVDERCAEVIRQDVPVLIKWALIRAVSPKALDRFPLRANREFDAASVRLRGVIDDIVAASHGSDDNPDLLSWLLAARDADTGEALTDTEVRDELVTIMFTGTEAAATTLSWTFHELAREPDVEKRLAAEVADVVGDGPVELQHIGQMEYLSRVLDEVSRLHAVPLLMRRAVEPVELGGFRIPAGTELAYSLYALHQDRRLYPDPGRFDPDRWLPENTEGRPREAFVPFGEGTRKCIGEAYARMQMAVAVATVIQRWQLVPEPGKRVREVAAAMAHPDRLPMSPVPRSLV